MPESSETTEEKGQEQKTSVPTSPVDWEAQAKHFQAIADKRDAENKTLESKNEKLEKAQEDAHKKELLEKEKFGELYEETKVRLETSEKEKAQLNLQVGLQNHLAEKYPDYVNDFRWIAPHVSSEEDIASVAERYVQEHPKAQGQGTASLGNKAAGDTTKDVSLAELTDPAKVGKFLEDNPDILQQIDSEGVNLV